MNNFSEVLEKELYLCQFNNYGSDNYDEYRFGKNEAVNEQSSIPQTGLKNSIISFFKPDTIKTIKPYISLTENNIIGLSKIYSNLNSTDKKLLIALIAYRHYGFKKVKLPSNNTKYLQAIATANTLIDSSAEETFNFLHFTLHKFDLTSIGFDIRLFFAGIGIATDFILEQYAYKQNNGKKVTVNNGDTVLDIGACWGDTALYFAHKAGQSGKVYSFEFIPENIKLYTVNINLNPNLKDNIELVPYPVSNSSNTQIYYKDLGPGSTVADKPFEGQTGSTTTISIDDFVMGNNITAVDFIKMDIEGSEQFALQGAINTIKKFRPKLAIAIYHSMDDFINIPNWILDLGIGYEIFIDHFTIHAEETVCFAQIK